MKLQIPNNYRPLLNPRQTEGAIKEIKDFFQMNLASELRLRRVTAPLFVQRGMGINDVPWRSTASSPAMASTPT